MPTSIKQLEKEFRVRCDDIAEMCAESESPSYFADYAVRVGMLQSEEYFKPLFPDKWESGSTPESVMEERMEKFRDRLPEELKEAAAYEEQHQRKK